MGSENTEDLMFSQGQQGQRNFEQRSLYLHKNPCSKQDIGGGVVIKDGNLSGGRVKVKVTVKDDIKE